MSMTYKELADLIMSMSEVDQVKTATVFVPGVDEYYPAAVSFTDDSCDVLDESHPVITIGE